MTKKILVLHTGGTISMQADEAGAVRTSADNPMNHISNPLEASKSIPWIFSIYQVHISNPSICLLFTKR